MASASEQIAVLRASSARRRAENRAKGEQRTYPRVRARPIVADTRVMITRRCQDRRMFLTPGCEPGGERTPEELRNFYGYTVARAVKKYGADFHAGIPMGNHHHLSITDRFANRPEFKNSVHSNLARGLNTRLGRFDSVWSGGGSCDTVTPSDDQTLEDLAYIDCNAVAAGLVKWGHLWPGFTTAGWAFGETREFVLPDWYYDPDNPDNEPVISLTRVRPDIFPELSDEQLSQKLFARCREIAKKIQSEMQAKGRRFMGVKKLLKTRWWRRAESPEERFSTVPTVASSQASLRVKELTKNEAWRRAYADRKTRIERGEPVRLPYGAYYLPRFCSFPVEAKPP